MNGKKSISFRINFNIGLTLQRVEFIIHITSSTNAGEGFDTMHAALLTLKLSSA